MPALSSYVIAHASPVTLHVFRAALQLPSSISRSAGGLAAMRKTRFIVAVLVLVLGATWITAAEDPLASAQSLLRRGDYGGAAQAYQSLLTQQPKSPAVHAGLTLALLKQEKIDEALANAQAAVKAMPEASELHSALADVYFRKALIVEADQAYRKAAELDKKNARAWLGMGRLSAGISKFKTSKKYYDYAYSLDPGDPDVLWHWASTRKNRKDEVAALEKYLATVVNEDPDELQHIQAHLQLHKEIGEQKLFQLVSKYSKADIPMTMLLDGPYRVRGVGLRVSFNGGKQESLLIDTGASGLLLNRKAAEKYGIKRLTATRLEGIGDKGPVGVISVWRSACKLVTWNCATAWYTCLIAAILWVKQALLGPTSFPNFS
jgi:tetratricopeptide (TPR) repeat protein